MIAVTLWDISPWGTSSVKPENSINNSAMIQGWFPCSGFLRWQQRLELHPLLVRQICSATIISTLPQAITPQLFLPG
jgi:hypothetical protein